MINRRLEDITAADLQDLVANEVREGKTIEYKRDLPGDTKDDRKEFCADVSSFANTGGGDLLLGVEEKDGLAEAFPGVNVSSTDDATLRLESILRDGIQPRVPEVQYRYITVDADARVLLL